MARTTKIFTIDFETYYDSDYSLSKMSTEDYVADDRFEIMMVGLKCNHEPTKIYSADTLTEYRDWLLSEGVDRGAVLCHNTMFDALILQQRLQIVPSLMLDTLGMAQALLKPFHRSISLSSCLKHTKSPFAKGSYVGDMRSRRLSSLTDSEFRKYAEYCTTDVDGEWWLFNHLKPQLPAEEYLVIDMTLRMYIEPQFELDLDILKGVAKKERDTKRKLLAAVSKHVKKTQLTSNPQFAKILEKFGVEVPYKISPTTLKPTYAFAKNDPEWKDLEDEYAEDPIISAILDARLAVKSTIGETRAARFLEIADRYGQLRIPLRYYGAHTGRYAGMQKINCQNLPRIPKGAKTRDHLRYAVKAPEGQVVLAADLSQIEARINAWLSGCDNLLQVFRDNGDPYCAFASRVYNRLITKSDAVERFVGKTCILGLGYGMGWKKLQSSLRKDNMKVSDAAAERYVRVYRDTYCEIPQLWRSCDNLIADMASGNAFQMIGPVCATKERLTLPNGMSIHYNNLLWADDEKYSGWSFEYAGRRKKLWGGTMVENIVQALARITVVEHMVEVRRELGLHPALQAHDELVYCVNEDEAEHYCNAILDIMKTPPSFAPDLPIDAEAAWGATYGDAK